MLDNVSTSEKSGVIRAFDVNTGALVWNWDSGRPDVTTPLAPGEHSCTEDAVTRREDRERRTKFG